MHIPPTRLVVRALFKGLLVFSVLLLDACVLATPPPQPTSRPEAAYTAAAETIIAQLTEVANSPTPTFSNKPGRPTASKAAGALATNRPTQTSAPSDTPIATQPPSDTPAPTLTSTPETPSPTPEPTFTPVPGDPKAELGQPDWRDTFENTDNWPVYEDEHVTMKLKDNGLEMTALNADKWDSWMLSWQILQDFYLEVTAKPGKCSGMDHYGLLARAPSADEAYLFSFTCDGQYSLRRWNGKRTLYLVEWTASDFIQSGAGQTNRLGLRAEGSHLSLYANGHLLTEVRDSSYRRGGYGILAGANQTPGFTVLFSEVDYWVLQ